MSGLLPSRPERWLRAVLGDTPTVSTIIGDLREEYGHHPAGVARSVRYAAACLAIAARYVPALMLDVLRTDLRHSTRALLKARTYTVASVATLALGIGIAATLLTITYGSLLRPLPYPASHELIGWGQTPLKNPVSINSIAVANLRDLASGLEQWQGLAGYSYRSRTLIGAGGAERVLSASVTANFFDVLQARPLLGRTFVPEDDMAGAERTVVLSERLWRRDFASRSDILGVVVHLDALPHRVIGVMPQHLPWPGNPQAWTPMQWTAEEAAVRSRRAIEGIGRRRPHATLASATDELKARFAALASAYPKENGQSTVATRPLTSIIVGSVGPNQLLPLLAGLAVLMLGVAYLNLGTLSIGRREARQHEYALRQVLGASGWRQRFSIWTESGLVAVAGAAVGSLIAAWSIPFVLTQYGSAIARAETIAFDHSTVVVIMAAMCLAAMVMATTTTTRRSCVSVGDLNRRSATGRPTVRRHLVAVQIALAGGLVYGAVLVGGMIASLARVDLGVPLEGALTFTAGVPSIKYDSPARIRGFFADVERELRALPGVTAVGATSRTPFAGGTNGDVADADDATRTVSIAEWRAVTPQFFSAIGLEIVDGATFQETPSGESRIVVISAALSEQLFGTRHGTGRRVRVGTAAPYTVTGVVSDIRDFGPTRPGRPTIYFAHGSDSGFPSITELTIVLRAAPIPSTASIRQRVAAVDPEVPIRAVATLDALATRSLGADRTTAGTVLVTMAALALVLGMVGVFGVAAVNVEQRTREIGVRLALGDTPTGILRMILSDGMRLAIAGVVMAAGVAWYVHRLVESFLVPVYQPHQATTAAIVVVLLVCAALVACFLPARRAARLSPTEALRAD